MRSLGNARRAGILLAAVVALAFVSMSTAQELCTSCHGPGGNSMTSGVPSIAAQPKTFLENQLVLIREGMRVSPVMQPIVAGMKDAEITQLAEHFSKLPSKPSSTVRTDAALAKRGAEVARGLHCGVCHLSDYRGQNQVPRLAGQRVEFLVTSMREFRDGKRSGGDTIMAAVLHGVSNADIDALAHFLAARR
ncbi:MAG TPA: c-type cytochrome [Casimicrobiaceae bacterium]|nr:c-type cytochrome [Casimicrobiaceae bacterium]